MHKLKTYFLEQDYSYKLLFIQNDKLYLTNINDMKTICFHSTTNVTENCKYDDDVSRKRRIFFNGETYGSNSTIVSIDDDILFVGNEKVFLDFNVIAFTHPIDDFCFIFSTCVTEIYLFDILNKNMRKKIEFFSADTRHYYENNTIFKLNGEVVFSNLNIPISANNFLCNATTFVNYEYDHHFCPYDETNSCSCEDGKRYKYYFYEIWNRLHVSLYDDDKYYNSIIFSLLCNRHLKQMGHNLPKFVLLYIFDLF
jgi:hypothetical protein